MDDYRRSVTEWYLARLEYYDRLLETPGLTGNKFMLFESFGNYTTLQGIRAMREFWFTGLVNFIMDNEEKSIEFREKRKRQRDQKEEDRVRERAELSR